MLRSIVHGYEHQKEFSEAGKYREYLFFEEVRNSSLFIGNDINLSNYSMM